MKAPLLWKISGCAPAYIWYRRWGGRSICHWAGHEDFQCGSWRFWKKYCRETAFSKLDGAGNYWKKYQEIWIWNNNKRYFDIWTYLKIFFGTLWRLKSQNGILQYANVNLFLYFIDFNNVITKLWNIWYIARGGWVGFNSFLTNIFLITFKYLQNRARLCFNM